MNTNGIRDDSRTLRRVCLLAAVLAVMGAVALAVDLPTVRTCFVKKKGGEELVSRLPGDLGKGINICEAFGHGVGIGLILLSVYVIDPSRRRQVPRMIACVAGAGIAANLIKLLVARIRPHSLHRFDLDFSQITVWETFRGLLPLGIGGSSMQSVPSAHSAVAAGLAVALAWQYPRGRWLFAVFAVLAGAQRVFSGSHYVSDVCWGLALGWIVASALIYTKWSNRLFVRIEGEPGPSGS